MNQNRRSVILNSSLLVTVGLLSGAGIAGFKQSGVLLLLPLLVLSSIGEWLEVRLGPMGSITLRPVIAFVALWVDGPASLMFVGLLPIFLVGLVAGRASLRDYVVTAGRDTVAFLVASMVYGAFRGIVIATPLDQNTTVEVLARCASIFCFWAFQIPVQAMLLTRTEGIRPATMLRHLLRHAWPHVLVLSAGSIALSYIQANFGFIVMSLATVMLIETYYPWRLLGEQGGVLLTSLQMMAQAVDLKDPYTSNHSQRVSRYAVRIARAMGLPEDEVERVRIGAFMHDIGKIGISGRIIRKPGKLTAEEQVLMRLHSSVSANIIQHLEILGESAKMVRHHHENWDGTGYPDGLKGEEIPLGARIIFVADALDAVTTDRPYRKGASRAEAIAVIQEHAGTQFDPTVAAALERISASL